MITTLGRFAFALILACGASCVVPATYDEDSVRHRLPLHLHLLLVLLLVHDVTGVAAVLAILHLTSRLCCSSVMPPPRAPFRFPCVPVRSVLQLSCFDNGL